MARINFEERIFKDQGFQDLMIAVQSRIMAKGIVVELFQLAQEFWFPNCLPIPMDRFKAAGLPEILYAPGGLAELRDGGVYVRGSKDAFAWLFQKSAAGSAPKKPRKSKRTITGVSTRTVSKSDVNESERLESSLLSSPYSSLSSHDSNSLDSLSGVASLAPDEPLSAITKTWRAYKTAYAQRYGQQPAWGPKAAGQLKEFCKQIPETDAPSVAEFYVRHPKTIYIESMSSIGLMVRDATALRTQWLNGKPLTDGMVSEYRKKAIEPRTRGIAEILADKEKRESEIQLQIGGADGSV